MQTILRSFLLASLVVAGPALAQQTTTETADEEPTAEEQAGDLDMGTVVGEGGLQEGQPYERETFGDWSVRCVFVADGPDGCQLYQLLQDEDGNSVAEIAMFPLPEGNRAAAGATIVAPLETYLPSQLTLSVDGGEARQYPFTFCSARPFSPLLSSGCVARVGFTQAAVDQFRAGANATLVMRPAVDPEAEVRLNISLSGFTAAFEAGQQPPAE